MAKPCARGLTIAHSNKDGSTPMSRCLGSTGDVCEYDCDPGYVRAMQSADSEHVCQPNGGFEGGGCIVNTSPGSCPPLSVENSVSLQSCLNTAGSTCLVVCDMADHYIPVQGNGRFVCVSLNRDKGTHIWQGDLVCAQANPVCLHATPIF